MNQVVERGTKRDKEIPGVPDPETISDLVRTLRAAPSVEALVGRHVAATNVPLPDLPSITVMDPRVSEVRLSAVSKDFDREIIALCRARSFAEVGFLGDAVLEAIQKSSERFAKRHGAFLLKSTDASGYNDHLKAFERVLIFDAVPARLGLL